MPVKRDINDYGPSRFVFDEELIEDQRREIEGFRADFPISLAEARRRGEQAVLAEVNFDPNTSLVDTDQNTALARGRAVDYGGPIGHPTWPDELI